MTLMAKNEETLDVGRLRELLFYDNATGVFVWRIQRHRSSISAWTIAGYLMPDGYRRICIDLVKYPAHRLAWLHNYGEWPQGFLDHINGQRDDNRIANLRLATIAQNAANMRGRSPDALRGVDFDRKRGKYRAKITAAGVTKYIGLFSSADAAHRAYLAEAERLHGEFAYHRSRGCTP